MCPGVELAAAAVNVNVSVSRPILRNDKQTWFLSRLISRLLEAVIEVVFKFGVGLIFFNSLFALNLSQRP